jgi:photosystem II stability/assembly factor-like uncharacterized protein
MQKKGAARFSALAIASFVIFGGNAVAGPNQWTRRGPAGGSVSTIAVHPDVPTTVFLGTPAGIYKTVDGGDTWRPVSEGLTDPDVVAIAVGAGWSDDLTPAIIAGTRRGLVFRSVDGGEHWSMCSSLPGYVSSFLIDRLHGSVYAASAGKIARSDDNGRTWEVFSQTSYVSTILGGYPEMYASSRDLIFVINDRGRLLKPVPALPFNARSADVDREGVLLIGFGGVVALSRNRGTSWETLPRVPTNTQVFALRRYPGGSLASTGEGIFRLRDGESGWTQLVDSAAPFPLLAYAATDPGRVFAARRDAVDTFHRLVEGSGKWETIDLRLSVAPTAEVALGEGSVFAATKYGLSRISEGAEAWTPVPLRPDFGTGVRSVNAVDGTLFVSDEKGLHRSRDDGATWTTVSPGSTAVSAIRVAPSDAKIVYAAFATGMAKSADGGDTWGNVQSNMPFNYYFNGLDASSVVVAPANPDIVYVCHDSMYRTSDGGGRWEPVLSSEREGIQAVAFDPKNASVLYGATWNGFMLKSDDTGKTWRHLELDGWVTTIVVDPSNSATVYAGTADGQIFRSTTAGAHWKSINTGLPGGGYMRSLTIDPRGKQLYAATMAGVFEYTHDESYLAGAATRVVSLRTSSGNYVSAADCGDTAVVGGPQNAAACETFTLFDVNGGSLMDGDRIYLRSAGGNFVAAENGGASACGECDGALNADRVVAGPWETFTVRRAAGDGPIAEGDPVYLLSVNGDYVSAERGGLNTGALRANARKAAEWETFKFELR